MESSRDDYATINAEAGIPPAVVQRLDPTEAAVLAHVMSHRERLVSEEELALAVLGQTLESVRKELHHALFMAGLSVAEYVLLRSGFTHFRGQFTVGVRWEPCGESAAA